MYRTGDGLLAVWGHEETRCGCRVNANVYVTRSKMATEREPKLSWEVKVPVLLQSGTLLTKWEEVMHSSPASLSTGFFLKFGSTVRFLFGYRCTFLILHLLIIKLFFKRFISFHFRNPTPVKTVNSSLINMASFFPGTTKRWVVSLDVLAVPVQQMKTHCIPVYGTHLNFYAFCSKISTVSCLSEPKKSST